MIFGALVYFSAFLLGALMGSFLNCVAYRLGAKKSFVKGRSFCPKCHHTLSWPDLVPLVSFFALQGRCRYCQKKISWQYPLAELGTGLLFLLLARYVLQSAILFGAPIFLFGQSFLLGVIVSCLVVIFIYDLKHYLIPDQALLLALAAAAILKIIESITAGSIIPLGLAFLWALLASAFFFVFWFFSQGKWMGFGDVKLAFLLGFFLGWPGILVALFLAFLFGAIIGIVLIILGRKKMKSAVPFGPFLIAGTFVGLFWGTAFWEWYLRLIFS